MILHKLSGLSNRFRSLQRTVATESVRKSEANFRGNVSSSPPATIHPSTRTQFSTDSHFNCFNAPYRHDTTPPWAAIPPNYRRWQLMIPYTSCFLTTTKGSPPTSHENRTLFLARKCRPLLSSPSLILNRMALAAFSITHRTTTIPLILETWQSMAMPISYESRQFCHPKGDRAEQPEIMCERLNGQCL